MLPSSTATSTELPGLIIHDPTISGVLLVSHRARITGSCRWSAWHSSEIDRLSISQAAGASSGTASRISISIASTRTFGSKRSRANRGEQDRLHWGVDWSRIAGGACTGAFRQFLEPEISKASGSEIRSNRCYIVIGKGKKKGWS